MPWRRRAPICDPPGLDFVDFTLSHLGSDPVRVLEVGCGDGRLALALAARGHDVTAIDPAAPRGSIFERVTLEDFEPPQGFDAVVASRSLHHIADLERAFDKTARLAPLLILEEFAWDRLDARSAEWYLAHSTTETTPVQRYLEEWAETHDGLHGHETLRSGLDRRYDERFFEWRPSLYRYSEVTADERSEQAQIDAGAIAALGFRYVGSRSTLDRAEPTD